MKGEVLIVARFAVMSCWLVGRAGEVRSSLIPDCVLSAALTSSIEFLFLFQRLLLCQSCRSLPKVLIQKAV